MLITVPSAATATLNSLMTEAQRTAAANSIIKQDGRYNVRIANTGANIVYIEMGAAAATASGTPIAATSGVLELTTENLSKIQLIAATGDTAVRVLIS
jgi:hypothetical protein